MQSFVWWVLRVTNLALLFSIAGIGGVLLGSYSGIAQVVPKISDLTAVQPGSGSRIISADGVVLATVATENRQYVPLDRIPAKLQEAVVATEDREFYKHIGVDPRGIARAVYRDVRAGEKREGGSTITQQLARNLYLTRKRTFSRKLAEMVLAVQLERAYTKPEILELYLNQIYFGEGAYGVQVAAKTYFGKDISKLDTAECALLAGLVRAPERYSPFEDEQRAQDRRDRVLSIMQEQGYLSPEEAAEAKAEPLHLVAEHKPLARSRYLAPWFVSYVIKQFEDEYGPGALYQGNYTIQTTLNYEMQKAADEAVRQGLVRARGFGADQMALVSLDARTGAVKALVGGADWGKNQYNVAVQGVGRQPGSAFKPFVYTAALLQGYGPDTRESDARVSYRGANGRPWSPHDYEASKGSHGWVSYKQALYMSLNVVAVKVADKVGIGTVIDVAEKMGIPKGRLQPYLPTAIGAGSVTPLEMASAFSIFATRGMRTEPYAIERVIDPFGRVVDQHKVVTWRVLDQNIAATMVDMMTAVIENPYGTAARIYPKTRGQFKAAGKTGTSSNFKDAWFVGYTDDLCTAVWTGNHQFTQPMHSKAVGGTLSAPVWADYMLKAQPTMVAARDSEHPGQVEEIKPPAPPREHERRTPPRAEPIPPELMDDQNPEEVGPATDTRGRNIERVAICPESELLAGPNCPSPVVAEYDLSAGDKPPTRVCDIHNAGAERASERPRIPRRQGRSGDKVTLPVCAITKQLATEYCPVVENMTFNVEDAPTQTCTRHGRR